MIEEQTERGAQAAEPKVVAEEHITWANGGRVVVPRTESPRDTDGRGSVRPIMLNPLDFLEGYQVGRDGPPKVLFRAADDSVIVEVSNLNVDQMVPNSDREFWHRDMDYGELQFCYKGARTVETENGAVSHKAGEFIYFPRGIAHRNNGQAPEVLCLVIYIRSDLIPATPDNSNHKGA